MTYDKSKLETTRKLAENRMSPGVACYTITARLVMASRPPHNPASTSNPHSVRELPSDQLASLVIAAIWQIESHDRGTTALLELLRRLSTRSPASHRQVD